VFDRVLDEADTSPLVGLARQVAAAPRRIVGLLRRARRQDSPGATETLGEILRSHWNAAEGSLQAVALRYNELYVQRPLPPSRTASPHAGAGGSEAEGSALDGPPAVG
jgi:hypothetical protein